MPLKTLEQRREYQRARRARLKAERTAASEAVVNHEDSVSSESMLESNITPPSEDLEEAADEVEETSEQACDNVESSEESSDDESTDVESEDEQQPIQAQSSQFSKIMLAITMSFVLPLIGVVVERMGGNADAIKKKELTQSGACVEAPQTSQETSNLASSSSINNIDDLGLKFT